MIHYTLSPEDAHKAQVGGNHITVIARMIHVACLSRAEGHTSPADFPQVLAELVEFQTSDRRFKIKWKSATTSYRSGSVEYQHESVSWYHLNGSTEFDIAAAR